ncbi:methyltransferase family protein [Thiogranum longum]|uniref:Methyltransferase family protein n=1 Tax=Thiogranum longum TaxID=1537524 RepID=A0A4R1H8E4_9GAMM|nr:tetratricopeptide repeat protein [Thiogranum longum]TCK17508.1 methyltransferase family protein [Thiogranum longum]
MATQMNGNKLAKLFRQAAAAHQAQQYREAQAGYQKILKWVPDDSDVLHLLGQSLIQDGRPDRAIRWLKKAVATNPASADAFYDLGLAYRKSGQNAEAVQAYQRVLKLKPDTLNAHLSLVEIKFPGEHYTAVLRDLHRHLKPETYIEIGVETGQSIALAEPRTLCLGVDPEPEISHELPPKCRIFPQTSDSFFDEHNVRELLGQRAVDFAFIDGMHVFEAALRDFINVERHASPGSVVAIHDCIPLDAVTSSRERTTNFWSGDIWKLILCLKKYRPDVSLVSVATKPTGLGLVTGLDPDNSVLSESYEQIVAEFVPLGYDDIAAHEVESLNVIDNDMQRVIRWIGESRSMAA